MEHEVIMPQLERTMKRTRIVEWRRMEGHDIKRGQVLFVAETTKGTYNYESKVSGVLSKILVQSGEFIDTQGVVGIITSDGESE
jgi:dihydrolipoamide dehydrogenase